MNRVLTVISLLASFAALFIAIDGRKSGAPVKPDPAEIRAVVDAELQRRETETVAAMLPKFRIVYQDMLGDDAFKGRDFNPKTFAELLLPLAGIITKMQDVAGEIPPQK